MSEGYEVWWVDDDSGRESEEVESLRGESDRLSVSFYLPEDLMARLDSEDIDTSGPDLFLIDWFLHQKSDYGGTGMSFEGRIRYEFPEVPVYGFSAKKDHSNFEGKRGEERFDKLFTLSDLTQSDAAERLINDIEDYTSIKKIRGDDEGALIGLLSLPDKVRTEDLSSALPREFNGGIPEGEDYEPGDVLRFARWVRTHLLEIPGLLWDKKMAATKLGLKEEAFAEVRGEFEAAEYSGIFEPFDETRWWRSEVIAVLLDLSEGRDLDVESPWRSGPEILGVDNDALAECVVCGDHYPETVGYLSVDSDEGFPVHFRCSSIEKPREGVFDDLRIIRRDEK